MKPVTRLVIAAGLVAGGLTPALMAQDPPEAGKAAFTEHCGMCHTLDTVTNKQASGTEWREIVERMRTNGAELTPQEADVIVAYLTKHHGPPAAGAQ